MDNVLIRGRRGTLHFIRFPTSEMSNFLLLAKSKGMATLVTTVCATGGGAYKFEENFRSVSCIYFFNHFAMRIKKNALRIMTSMRIVCSI